MLDKYSKYEAVMVVGHNPSISEFLARLVTKSGCEAQVDFKRAQWRESKLFAIQPTLNWFFTPKIAREIHAAARSLRKSTPKTSRK